MPAYKVVLPSGGYTLLNGNNSMVVFAGNATDAKNAALGYSDADAAPWGSATVTELTEDATLAGLRIEITIAADAGNDATFDGEDLVYSYTIPSGASADTVDEVGDLIVAELNALPQLAGVTYTGGSDTITIVEANNCGLAAITAKVYETGTDGISEFENTSMALTVGAVGVDASSDRTIVLTPLSSGVRTTALFGYHTAL